MRIALVYASMTGNTEMIANHIEAYLANKGVTCEAFHINREDFFAFDLPEYDGALFGAYTYGNGTLPFELMDFYEELDDEDLGGMTFGLFGSCDSYYPLYGVALEQLKEKFEERGGKVVGELVKVDLSPDRDDLSRAEGMVDVFLKAIED